MQIQVNTDHNVHGGEGLATFVTTDLETSLSRFDGWLTRVEVHLSEDGGGKPEDKKCVIEARPGGKQPVAVTHHATTVDDAYSRRGAQAGQGAGLPVHQGARPQGRREHPAHARTGRPRAGRHDRRRAAGLNTCLAGPVAITVSPSARLCRPGPDTNRG